MRLAFFLFALLCSTLPAHAAKTILVMGDSLSAGYGIRPEQAWPALLGQRLSEQEADDMTAYLESLTGEQPQIVLPILPPSRPDTPRPEVKS